MRTPKGPNLIQADARGRIQLPPELRKFRLFQLTSNEGIYELCPLDVVPASRAAAKYLGPWLKSEVADFLKASIFPKLQEYFQKHSNNQKLTEVEAAFLYGSRARGDALSGSDFDLGLLVNSYPSFQSRQDVSEAIQAHLSRELQELKEHKVRGDFSIQFFLKKVPQDSIPPIYFSIATDGILIWDCDEAWDIFQKDIKAKMSQLGIHSQGSGKLRRWIWRGK